MARQARRKTPPTLSATISHDGAFREAVLRLVANLDLESLLQTIVEEARSLSGARYGALGVLDEEGRISRFVTSGMSPEERERLGDFPTGRGILGLLVTENRPIRLSDLTQHPSSVGLRLRAGWLAVLMNPGISIIS